MSDKQRLSPGGPGAAGLCFVLALAAFAGAAPKGGNPNRTGYYVFMGRGDYKDEFGPKTPFFTLADWERLIDRLKAGGATTFLPLVTGHRLPYPSRAFPQYVETDANTAKDVDPQRIIDYAKRRGLEVILVFTTTGHCNAYARDHPEQCILDERGRPANALCPNREGATRYPLGVLEEVFTRYRNFDGLLVHPPETRPECFCPECRSLFKRETGSELATASPRDRRRFFIRTFLGFAGGFFARAAALAPLSVKTMFNCDWLDDDPDLTAALPEDVDIIYWDYNLSDAYLQGRFQENLRRYLGLGRTIWYMPSTIRRWWTPADADLAWGCGQVVKQVEIARRLGVRNIAYFVGAYVDEESLGLISAGSRR